MKMMTTTALGVISLLAPVLLNAGTSQYTGTSIDVTLDYDVADPHTSQSAISASNYSYDATLDYDIADPHTSQLSARPNERAEFAVLGSNETVNTSNVFRDLEFYND